MKKIILVVLLALSLYGSDSSCSMAYDGFQKQQKAYVMAFERWDVFQMKIKNKMKIYFIEKAIIECSDKPYLKELKVLRESAISDSAVLKKL